MTPIGHFTSSGLVAGISCLISPKVTTRIILYYILVMGIFFVWIRFPHSARAVQLYIDWAGNVASIFILVLFFRGTHEQRLFIGILVGSQLLAGFSHCFDGFVLWLNGSIPNGMWRPHHFWHTPVFAVVYSALVTPLFSVLLRLKPYRDVFAMILIGYLLHILADTITYDFPIYWFWPLTDKGAVSIARAWIPPGDHTGFANAFGNPLYHFGFSPENPYWGWTMYRAELVVNLLLATLFFIQRMIHRQLKN